MSPRGRALILIAIVTTLGILVYCSHWSNHWVLPWQLLKDAAKECSTCSPNGHPMMEAAAKERTMPVELERFEPFTPPTLPCGTAEHHGSSARSEADVLSHGHFISESKNPCWWNGTSKSAPPQLQCLPYFFLAGVSKCGSTDIFSRISGHPQVIPPGHKEPRWFDWRRYRLEDHTFTWYVSNFMQASWQISRDIGRFGMSEKVVGDGSPTYFWRNFHWPLYPGNEGCSEPRYVISDVIHQLLPQTKIILSFRDPVSSIYSKYLSEKKGERRSPEHFHKLVIEELGRYQRCFARSSVRKCAYNISLSDEAEVRMEKGLYAVYLSDWLRVFPWKQLHIIRFEDYIKDIAGHLQDIFHFLELDEMSDSAVQSLAALPPFNQGNRYSVGQMLPATQRLLRQFYFPFNAQLAHLLNDKRYLWR